MFDIKIGKFQVTADDRQYILSELKIKGGNSKTTGEKYYKELRYYTKLDSLVNALVELLLRRSDITTLKEFKSEYTALSRSVTASLYPEEKQNVLPGFN